MASVVWVCAVRGRGLRRRRCRARCGRGCVGQVPSARRGWVAVVPCEGFKAGVGSRGGRRPDGLAGWPRPARRHRTDCQSCMPCWTHVVPCHPCVELTQLQRACAQGQGRQNHAAQGRPGGCHCGGVVFGGGEGTCGWRAQLSRTPTGEGRGRGRPAGRGSATATGTAPVPPGRVVAVGRCLALLPALEGVGGVLVLRVALVVRAKLAVNFNFESAVNVVCIVVDCSSPRARTHARTHAADDV